MFDERLLPFIAKLSPTIMWIALTVGLLLFVIGYFAGGKLALGRISMCVLLVTIVSALALPAPIKLYSLVERGLNLQTAFIGISADDTTKSSASKKSSTDTTKSSVDKKSTSQSQDKPAPAATQNNNNMADENAPVSLQLFTFIMYLIWTAFVVGMGIFLYETLTVTAEEAERH